MSVFAYNWGMKVLDNYLDEKLSRGRSFFSKDEALKYLKISPDAFTASATRLSKKSRLISPWRGFYLILRPEDRAFGAPDPVRWIDPLMRHLNLDYRISLFRAAEHYGSSHQAVMVFQVVVPKQLRSFEIGRHRIQFVFQASRSFESTNRSEWLQQIKSDTGFAKVAGIELVLLDSARYFHKTGGINGLAQIVHDLGSRADPRILKRAADYYENSSVRRLGFLLEKFAMERQSESLEKIASKAKSFKLLDPANAELDETNSGYEKNTKWNLLINETVELDW